MKNLTTPTGGLGYEAPWPAQERPTPILSITGNDRLITNFPESDRDIYERAIKESGMTHLFIADGATSRSGHLLPNTLRLMATEVKGLGEFWKKLEALQG